MCCSYSAMLSLVKKEAPLSPPLAILRPICYCDKNKWTKTTTISTDVKETVAQSEINRPRFVSQSIRRPPFLALVRYAFFLHSLVGEREDGAKKKLREDTHAASLSDVLAINKSMK